MKAKDLKPDKRNPRKITQTKLDMLKKSLIKFGDMSGIVFNKRTGVLISGHQRLKVLPEDSEIVIERTFATPTESGTTAEGYVKLGTENMKYREVDVDLDTQMAMNIAANKHGGDWDIPTLNDILLDLDASNYDLELTGFSEDELENLLAPTNEIEDEEESKDDHSEKCIVCGK
jgi:ParB-like chromosome segregation protein Spo0J